ncbi:hypothetical protein GCM10011571_06110 [Marinithermofilum abyssi]|uniref:N-acetyltransferase domain-containing protein n=1 Tax=Marinithermofilum abyssi TaxID=1571185 RepID=A0A8J2VBL9_9BACL|nr:GNAT family N-acetyltransferase [Marinithermofilum abyssi]GGE07654.1 hypothetical protein GCM10011571_06110 [Marinithermofilum abyssi]
MGNSSPVVFYSGYDTWATIGMVAVDPDKQRNGLGQGVLQQLLQHADASLPCSLVATLAGVPLYRQCGFQTIEHIYKVTADNCSICHPNKSAQRLP